MGLTDIGVKIHPSNSIPCNMILTVTISVSFLNSSIPEGEKSVLRQKLIGHIHEPVLQVATQLAIIISKIAR
jgi:hypothetical protein